MGDVDHSRYVPILTELRELLLKYELLGKADVVSNLIHHAHLQTPELVRLLQSGSIWGSAGSISDTVFAWNEPGPLDQLERDDIQLLRLLVRLGDEMRAQGILLDRHASRVEAYRRVVATAGEGN